MPIHKSSVDEDDAAFEAQLMKRIEDMIERVVLETAFDLLGKFLDNKKSLRPPICYRSDCQRRDDIPF